MLFRSLAPILAACLSLSSAQEITSDTYFYGESPPVYPSPAGTGAGDWAAAYAKAKVLVSRMSMEEKINLTAGGSVANGCSGNIVAVDSVGFPGLCLSDAGNGLRATDFVNAYPAGFHLGASWNPALALQRGTEMGGEFYRKGVNVALGPVIGPLGRIALGGRNWEGISNDPYLCGALVYETVSGMQGAGVITSTKHFIANEQELNRNPNTSRPGSPAPSGPIVESVSSNIDDQTIHELYLWPFQEAVRAGTGSIMCSYNRVNNSHACQNSKTMNGLLKTELGFQGFVVSDWGAVHAGPQAFLAGLDMTMPSPAFGVANQTAQYTNGSVPESRLDDQATRIIAAWQYVNQDTGFPVPGVGMAQNYFAPHTVVDAKKNSAMDVLLNLAMEGHVLVKNVNSALPFKGNAKLVSLFGYDGQAQSAWDIIQPTTSRPPPAIQNSTMWVGGGSGYNNPAYLSDPLSAFQQRAYQDGNSIAWDFYNLDPQVDTATEACVVFINAYAQEGYDRINLYDDLSDGLVLNVASKCSNTIVVIHNAGIRLVDQWIDNVNVTAVIYAHLPGQDLGRSLVKLMYGDQSFSGKLPYTVAKNESDYGPLLNNSIPEGIFELFPQSNFSEGVYIDYRYFDKMSIQPRYEFGFGLSYTTFAYSQLRISKSGSPGPYPADARILPGGNPNLFKTVATVTAAVFNTGKVTAAEVAQVYVGIPGGPVRQLRGFSKNVITAGQSVKVTFELTRKDLSMWDTVAQQWLLQSGTYQIYVGSSSRDLPLVGTLTI